MTGRPVPRDEITGLVLAAGEGRRLGRPKALVELGGQTLLERAVHTLRAGGCDPVLAVVPEPPPGLLAAAGARLLPNPRWRTGMGSSLRLGLAHAPGDAVVVLLVDTPLVSPLAVRGLVTAAASGAAVAVATYTGRRGHPVLVRREHWAGVARLATGDTGARPFLATHPELVTEVDCTGTGDPLDIDTAEQLAELRARLERSGPPARLPSAP